MMTLMSNIKYQISKLIYILSSIFIALFIVNSMAVYGQTKTASSSQVLVSPTKSAEDKEIQTLKEKIATKVAELRQKNSKATSGLVTEKSEKKLKIRINSNEVFEVKLDTDLTKFYRITGNIKKEAKSSEVIKGSYIIVTGIMHDKSIDANSVYLDEPFIVDFGKITEVNTQEFYLKVLTTEKENYILDVETFSKQQMLNIKTLELERVGFSKIKEGDTIHFVVKKTGPLAGGEKEPNRFAAQKILLIPQEYFIR